jgi:hypothetical protein
MRCRATCGYKTNELNIENDRICAVKLVKRGYENVCIIGVNIISIKPVLSNNTNIRFFQQVFKV